MSYANRTSHRLPAAPPHPELKPTMTLDRYRQRLHDRLTYWIERVSGHLRAERRHLRRQHRRNKRWAAQDAWGRECRARAEADKLQRRQRRKGGHAPDQERVARWQGDKVGDNTKRARLQKGGQSNKATRADPNKFESRAYDYGGMWDWDSASDSYADSWSSMSDSRHAGHGYRQCPARSAWKAVTVAKSVPSAFSSSSGSSLGLRKRLACLSTAESLNSLLPSLATTSSRRSAENIILDSSSSTPSSLAIVRIADTASAVSSASRSSNSNNGVDERIGLGGDFASVHSEQESNWYVFAGSVSASGFKSLSSGSTSTIRAVVGTDHDVASQMTDRGGESSERGSFRWQESLASPSPSTSTTSARGAVNHALQPLVSPASYMQSISSSSSLRGSSESGEDTSAAARRGGKKVEIEDVTDSEGDRSSTKVGPIGRVRSRWVLEF